MKRISFLLSFFLFCFLFGSCTLQVHVENHTLGDETAPIVISASSIRKWERTDTTMHLVIGIGRTDNFFKSFPEYKTFLSIDAPRLIIEEKYSDHYEYEITDFSDEKYIWDANWEKGEFKPTYFQTFLISTPEDLEDGSGEITITWVTYPPSEQNRPLINYIKLYYAYNAEHIYFSSLSEKDAIYSL